MTQPISIVEVGARDGLQNAPEILSVEQKSNLIRSLLNTGLTHVEAGAFVRADRVPAMAGSEQLCQQFLAERDKLWYLVPNQKGLEAALEAGARQLAFFTAVSDGFNQKNIGMDVAKSIQVISDCVTWMKDKGYKLITDWNQPIQLAKDFKSDRQLKLRLYVSTVIACPYQGRMQPQATITLIEKLLPLGFSQVSLGDTLGVGVPGDWEGIFDLLDASYFKKHQIAMHCHDTYGTALACIQEGLAWGITTFDSSIGGLGGCPYAPGASGNCATEDVHYLMEQQGFKTGVDQKLLLDIFKPNQTGTLQNTSRVAKALKLKC